MKTKLSILLFAFCMFICPIQAEAAQVNDYRAVFDAQFYYSHNPDLQTAIGNDEGKLFQHFLEWGMKEGRASKEDFNVKVYMENNTDLQSVFGQENYEAYYRHYMQYGKKEGRIAGGNISREEKQEKLQETEVTEELLATCSTKYKTKTNRGLNIELSVERINNLIIQPGEIFSFSNSILPRTAENGYLVAPSYLNKQVVKSVGGGICQVSSTLYAALKTYGIPVIERHAHSLPVDYLPEGYDATIAEGAKDLRFSNNYADPIRLQAETKGGVITISVFGQKVCSS